MRWADVGVGGEVQGADMMFKYGGRRLGRKGLGGKAKSQKRRKNDCFFMKYISLHRMKRGVCVMESDRDRQSISFYFKPVR